MRDYARIMARIYSTPWLITEEAMTMVMNIVERRMINGRLTDDEIAEQIKLGAFGPRENESSGPKVTNGVGILPIYGPIFGKANLMTELSGATSLEAFQTDFRKLMDNRDVQSILLDMDTPGGTDEMVKEMGEEILAARDTKPINALANSMIGSAGYWLASQASKIYSTPSGSVGSIGAYTVHENRAGADDKQGVQYTFISAGPYKTEGNPHEPLSQEGHDYRQEVINELYDEFVTAVADGRGTTTEQIINTYGGGRMLRSKKALEAGMIDGITTYESLLGGMSEKQPVSIAVGGERIAAKGFLQGNVVHLSELDYEFTNPGETPVPVNPDDSAESGSRRDTPPGGEDGTVPNRSATVTNNKSERSKKHMADADVNELEVSLRSELGISDDVNLTEYVKSLNAELGPLRELKKKHAENKVFSENYPNEYAELQRLQTESRKNVAKSFGDKLEKRRFTKAVGKDEESGEIVTENTTYGLSAFALETITGIVEKFEDSTASLEDFTGVMDAIFDKGLVDYGDKGSTIPGQDDEDDDDSNDDKPAGYKGSRKMFADKVNAIMEKDELSLEAATAVAAEQYPKLYEAYLSPMGAN